MPIKLNIMILIGTIFLISFFAAASELSAPLVSPEIWGKTEAKNSSVSMQQARWFRDSKFAMFIHWGCFSQLAGVWKDKTYYGIGEWIQLRARIPVSEYETVAEQFNPTEFNADQWVCLARDAGMKYIVITAKHHEGFAMFKSHASLYNIVDATPFGRDPLKELSQACKKYGLKLGFYYSQFQDWHEPNAEGNDWDFSGPRDFDKYLNEKAMPQIRELLENYGPLQMIWFDTPGDMSPEESQMLVDMVRTCQPTCMINSRIGNGLGDYETLGDQEIPEVTRPGLWESIDTHNDTWGYVEYDQNWKSPREIITRLLKVISRGGNYMLNIGPDGKGRIPEMSADILRQVGRWISANSESIYGTNLSPLGRYPWGECTCRDGKLYLHILNWPTDQTLSVPGLNADIQKIYFLTDPKQQALPYKADSLGLMIAVPQAAPDNIVTVVVVETKDFDARTGYYVLNGLKNGLEASLAELSGCVQKKLSWMEKFGDWKHAVCISNWKGPSAQAKWRFTTIKPGRFYVEIHYSCPQQGHDSEWKLRVGNTETTFPLIDSGQRNSENGQRCLLPRFQTYRVGIIDLPSEGDYDLYVMPLDEKANTVNMKSVCLLPVI